MKSTMPVDSKNNHTEEGVIIYEKPDEEVEITHFYTIVYDSTEDTSDVRYGDFIDEEPNQPNELIEMEDIKKRFSFTVDSIQIGKLKKGDKHKVEYPFVGDASLIEKVKPGCGCTAEVVIDKENSKITAVFNSVNEAKGGFSKNIIVYFKDGRNLEITTPMGVKALNPRKSSITLKFSGHIV